jgi:deoxyhypusine synthase
MAEVHRRAQETELRPRPLELGMSVSQFIDRAFLGSTAGELAAAADLLVTRVLQHPETVLGVSLDAELVASGAGVAALAPLIRGGYIDWAAVTGSNLFYDALHALGKPFYRAENRPEGEYELCGGGLVIRRADLVAAEQSLREILSGVDFQQMMGSAGMHERVGAQLRLREKSLGVEYPSMLTTAHEAGLPIFNPSPVDNPLGSLMAHLGLVGNRLALDISTDLNEAAAILNAAHARGAACAVWCLGRGAASNFVLSVPRHLRAFLGAERAPRYLARIRMAGRAHEVPTDSTELRPEDRGGSRAGTPGSEAACGAESPALRQGEAPIDFALSTDLTVALPLLTAYILDRVPPRPLKRLSQRRSEMLDRLRQDHSQSVLRRPL